ncbi:MAG: DUF998 domain-containing protein [Acidimicrobiales bacterium]
MQCLRTVFGGLGGQCPARAAIWNRGSLCPVPADARSPGERPVPAPCGVLAGPLFVIAFTAIGATRSCYDWRRDPVSSLAIGRQGWLQRGNFVLAGMLYSCAARELSRCPRRRVGPRAVPVLVAGVGVGLIGSGVFVTDPVSGCRPTTRGEARSGAANDGTVSTRESRLHNAFAIPIFAGIPIAALASAAAAIRSRDYRWACYSAGSSLAMVGNFALFGAAFGPAPHLGGKGGIFQRLSIVAGFGWLTALSHRAGRCL